mgnify:CR=1 FL=1
MDAKDYMKQTLTNLYKQILTLPEDKSKELCEKAEQLLNSKNMSFTKFVAIINKWIDEQQ